MSPLLSVSQGMSSNWKIPVCSHICGCTIHLPCHYGQTVVFREKDNRLMSILDPMPSCSQEYNCLSAFSCILGFSFCELAWSLSPFFKKSFILVSQSAAFLNKTPWNNCLDTLLTPFQLLPLYKSLILISVNLSVALGTMVWDMFRLASRPPHLPTGFFLALLVVPPYSSLLFLLCLICILQCLKL